MRNRMLVLLALVAVLAVLVAAPVNADVEKPINGKIELTFVLFDCPEPAPGPFITWTGTVVIDGTTYGWADFPTDEFVIEGNFGFFEEYWTIFTLEGDEDPRDNPLLACDADRVVLEGVNDGWGPATANTGKADGTVTGADPDGPFAEVAPGSRMFWRGKILGNELFPGVQFKATLHISPLK